MKYALYWHGMDQRGNILLQGHDAADCPMTASKKLEAIKNRINASYEISSMWYCVIDPRGNMTGQGLYKKPVLTNGHISMF